MTTLGQNFIRIFIAHIIYLNQHGMFTFLYTLFISGKPISYVI